MAQVSNTSRRIRLVGNRTQLTLNQRRRPNRLNKHRIGSWHSLALAGLALALTSSVMAADVEIRVNDKVQGERLAGAAVCLGTGARIDQFGAYLTGPDGIATFTEVPEAPLVLTISRSSFKGHQSFHSAGRYNRVIEVSLTKGGFGAVCETAASSSDLATLRVWHLDINNGEPQTPERNVVLNARVEGNPTHYRASERADFSDTTWKVFATNANYELSPKPGNKTIYYQVRRFRKVNGGSMQSVSSVATATIDLASR